MKKILIIASLALCCSLLASCEDFLDTKKYGAKTDWETQEDVEKALVALFSFNTNDSEGVTGRGITWFECCSDDMTVGRPQGEAEDIRNFRMSPSNGRDVKNNWKIMYEVNAKANNIIKVVPTMNLDNAFKTKATGTAYFFRGFAMLWLSPYYGDNGPNGGIPIILDTTEPAAMDSPRPASVLQNYDQIISDLREAGKRLPLFSQLAPEEYGMPHKAAAWALAARAWNISPADALAAWLWSWLENQLAVLMKTLPLGQQAAQRLTSELLPLLQQAQQDASRIEPHHFGSAAIGLSLACMAHERQYSRLFRS